MNPVLFIRCEPAELWSMLQLKLALQEMEKFDENGRAIPFSLEFITCNRADGTGGEIIRLEKVILAKNTRQRKKGPQAKAVLSKRPNQWKNATRNLLILSSNEIRKCHIRLITELNGHTVIY